MAEDRKHTLDQKDFKGDHLTKYSAFFIGRGADQKAKHQARVRVHYPSKTEHHGISDAYRWADIKEIADDTNQTPEIISLICTGFIITIEGKNLEKHFGDL